MLCYLKILENIIIVFFRGQIAIGSFRIVFVQGCKRVVKQPKNAFLCIQFFKYFQGRYSAWLVTVPLPKSIFHILCCPPLKNTLRAPTLSRNYLATILDLLFIFWLFVLLFPQITNLGKKCFYCFKILLFLKIKVFFICFILTYLLLYKL